MTPWRDLVAMRWPSVAAAIRAARPLSGVERAGRNGELTLRVRGLHLTSAYDRLAEATVQSEAIPPESDEAWVYGVALGDVPRVLLRRPSLARLHVVILAPALAASGFDASDTTWLADPRVELVMGETCSSIGLPFVVAPACLRLAADEALPLRDALVLALAAPRQRSHASEMATLMRTQLAENEALCRLDGDVAALFGTRVGATVYVAGGGPSLSTQLAWLAENRGDGLLVAVTTALLPLQRAGIHADVAVVVEPKPGNREVFTAADPGPLATTPLVYLPTVCPETLAAWPGPRLTGYLDRPMYDDIRARIPKGELFCSGSVLHTAIDLAVRTGAHRVVLLGADFSYPSGQTHAEGAVYGRPLTDGGATRLTVVNSRGERVPSDPNLIGYLRDLETYIAARPDIVFVNAGRDGAVIRGTHPMEAIDERNAPLRSHVLPFRHGGHGERGLHQAAGRPLALPGAAAGQDRRAGPGAARGARGAVSRGLSVCRRPARIRAGASALLTRRGVNRQDAGGAREERNEKRFEPEWTEHSGVHGGPRARP
jgi:hypothetical protein